MKSLLLALFIAMGTMPLAATANATGVIINGHHLDVYALAQLQRQLGTRIAPGEYWVNRRNGCWINLTSGARGCLSRAGSPADRWVGRDELRRGGVRGVRPGPLTTYDFIR
ncbi:MAG: hypothetical protein AAF493_19140 [Pseudomonadota bacterium]